MTNCTYLISKRQAARCLGISVGLVERLMRAGLPHIRIGNLIKFAPEDLEAYINKQRVGFVEIAKKATDPRTRALAREGLARIPDGYRKAVSR